MPESLQTVNLLLSRVVATMLQRTRRIGIESCLTTHTQQNQNLRRCNQFPGKKCNWNCLVTVTNRNNIWLDDSIFVAEKKPGRKRKTTRSGTGNQLDYTRHINSRFSIFYLISIACFVDAWLAGHIGETFSLSLASNTVTDDISNRIEHQTVQSHYVCVELRWNFVDWSIFVCILFGWNFSI